MKYLKLYEAFKSKGISNTIKFLKNKIGSSKSERFISHLRHFRDNIDFPIDQISDSHIKYMNAKKALELKNSEKVSNMYGIWVIKYWFSLEKGFLGFTGTGNEIRTSNYENEKHGIRIQEKFSDNYFDWIKDNVTRTGEIWPVENYTKLKTGDTVIGLFDSSNQRNKISLAKIFVDETDNNRTYAIQSVSDGSTPDNSSWRSYTDFGSLSWWLFDNSEMGSDHQMLYYWRQSPDELNYIEPPQKEEGVEVYEPQKDPLTWNLPLTNRYDFSYWGRGTSCSRQSLSEADFALVLYFDDLVNPESDAPYFERPSDTQFRRRKEKEGATSLMSNEEIKKMNIERYIQKLTTSLNISETEFYNLEKIVNKHLAQEFSFFSILRNRPDWSNISEFTDCLYNVIDSQQSEKSYYVQRVKDKYGMVTKNYYQLMLKYQEAKKHITGKTELKLIFDELFDLGTLINKKLTSEEINSIDDLFKVVSKIRTISDFIKQSRNQLSYKVREVITGFIYPEDMKHYFDGYNNNYEYYNKDLEIIKRIENFVKSL